MEVRDCNSNSNNAADISYMGSEVITFIKKTILPLVVNNSSSVREEHFFLLLRVCFCNFISDRSKQTGRSDEFAKSPCICANISLWNVNRGIR